MNIPVPRSVEVLNIEPPDMELTLDNLVRKTVPVEVSRLGKLNETTTNIHLIKWDKYELNRHKDSLANLWINADNQDHAKLYLNYIYHSVFGFDHLTFRKSNIKVRLTLLDILKWLLHKVTHIRAECILGKTYVIHKEPTVYKLSSPCKTIFIDAGMYKNIVWALKVHKSLTINITIHKAYILQSSDCTFGALFIYQYNDLALAKQYNNETYLKLCGHIMMETMYTKNEKGMIAIIPFSKSTTVLLKHLHASYQTNVKGFAYRFRPRDIEIQGIYTRIRPSWIYYQDQMLEYIWYICNGPVMTSQAKTSVLKERGVNNEDVLSFPRRNVSIVTTVLKVENFLCVSGGSEIITSPGLLPKEYVQSSGKVTYCGTTSILILMSHKYMTILLRRLYSDATFNIELSFNHSITRNSEVLLPPNHDRIYTIPPLQSSVQVTTFIAYEQNILSAFTEKSQNGMKHRVPDISSKERQIMEEKMLNMRLSVTLSKLRFKGIQMSLPSSWAESPIIGNHIPLHNTKG